jgi:hypothetical protein
MSGSGAFSVTTAVAIVLGGIAATILVSSIVFGDAGRSRAARIRASNGSALPLTSGSPLNASSAGHGNAHPDETEYLLDVSEGFPPPAQR